MHNERQLTYIHACVCDPSSMCASVYVSACYLLCFKHFDSMNSLAVGHPGRPDVPFYILLDSKEGRFRYTFMGRCFGEGSKSMDCL